MDEQDKTLTEEEISEKPKKKKKHTWAVVLLVAVILAAAGGVIWYLQLSKEPQQAVEKFLTSVQQMDFETMGSLLQSSDLSALDNADIRNAAYTDFFKTINSKMTYKIVHNRFDFQNGTARITARIRYIDGTEIYKETVTEFLRQIVAKAFSGETLTEEETQTQLASILSEKADELEDQYNETDIVYPVIKTGDEWKIVALDAETVKMMSANFKSVEDEINQTLNDSSSDGSSTDSTAADGNSAGNASDGADGNSDGQTSDGTTGSSENGSASTGSGTDTSADGSENAAADSQANASDSSADGSGDTAGGIINLSTDRFTLKYSRHQVAKDFAGEDCLLVYYSFTNNSSSATSAIVDLNISASQNGASLEAAIPESNDEAIDRYMSEIQPGETATICQAFSLKDLSDVTLTASPAFDFSGISATQTLTLQ